MRRHLNRYFKKSKKIVGLTLALIGFIIVISIVPIQFLLFIIGIALLVMGGVLINGSLIIFCLLNYKALSTYPDLKHLVQTWILLTVPSTTALTLLKLGLQLLEIFLFEKV